MLPTIALTTPDKWQLYPTEQQAVCSS